MKHVEDVFPTFNKIQTPQMTLGIQVGLVNTKVYRYNLEAVTERERITIENLKSIVQA
jgi:hypothetical protein